MKTAPMFVVAGIVALVASPSAYARATAAFAAADFLVDAQGWYRGSVPTDWGKQGRVVRNAWEWRRGQDRAAPNTTGIIGLGLLDAHEALGRTHHLDAAILYGMALVNDFREVRSLTVPYRPDIEFLVRLSNATGDPEYREAAAAWFGNLRGAARTGEAEVQRILGVRGTSKLRTLVGYDLAFDVHAAVAVGDVKYAASLADATWAARRAWMTGAPEHGSWDVLSRAALLRAMAMLDASRYSAPMAELSATLLKTQDKDGSWAGSTQATAYALRGLLASDAPGAAAAATRAGRWLQASLGDDGAWPESATDTRRNIEVHAEALSAYLAWLD